MNKKTYISPEAEIEIFNLVGSICTLSSGNSGLEEGDNFGDLGDGGGLDGSSNLLEY